MSRCLEDIEPKKQKLVNAGVQKSAMSVIAAGIPSIAHFILKKREKANEEKQDVENFLNSIQPPEPETIYSKKMELHKYPSVDEMSKLGFYKSHREFRDIDMWSCLFCEIDYLRSKIDRLNKEIKLLKSKN